MARYTLLLTVMIVSRVYTGSASTSRQLANLTIMLARETVRLVAGAHIEMNWSYKYDRETLVSLLTTAGMQPVAQYDSVDKRFLTLLANRSS
jgi:uncharacterized SAM-dependent methyltransferase